MLAKLQTSQLNWLLSSLILVMCLHIAHQPAWVGALMIGCIVWRYLIERNGWALPSLWLLMPITLIVGLGVLLTYKSLFGRDAGVALLSMMLTLKLMEARNKRDFILMIFAGYFLTITGFLFSQSLLVGAFILIPTFALTATLVDISYPNGGLNWRFKTKLTAQILLQSIPMMMILFVLFPRIPGPLWGMPEDSYSSMTGLSDSMSPGNISSLTLSGKTAFRVQFDGDIPPSNQLYWRGPVLWHYDGRTWNMMSAELNIPKESLSLHGASTEYSVTLEPHNRNWLLMLDMPSTLPANALLTRDMQVVTHEPVRNRILYKVSSNLSYTLAEELSPLARELALQLNDDQNPRTFALAKSWQQSKKSPEAIVNAALKMFREQNFAYTLRPPLLSQLSPIDDFLFNTQRGFCEHYASSFVFLMRAAGVPARVVTGYQGGEVNPIGKYLIVRQSDAHAWAEVWLEGRGWVRLDPTAAVSPTRIESGIEAALPGSDIIPLMSRPEFPMLRKIYLNWDAMNNGWNQYVLGYNQQRQLALLSKLTGGELSMSDLIIDMILSLAAFGLVVSFFLLRGKHRKMEPVQRYYAQFLSKLKKAGLEKPAHEGALDFCQRAQTRLPANADVILNITQLYQRLRYSPHQDAATLAQFKQLIKAFKQT